MRVEVQKDKLDLGTTPIENMFINTLMASANESQIKVYLYALSLAHSGNNDITNENIAKEMNLTEGQVHDAWNYWIDLGLVEKTDDGYIFKSMISNMLEGMGFINSENNIEKTQKIKKENVKEGINASGESKLMIEQIEAFLSEGSDINIKLNIREIRKIIELMNDFNIDPEFIQYAYMIASKVRSNKTVDVVVATIRNWLIEGATDMEKLDSYLENSNKSIKYDKKTYYKDKKMLADELISKKDNRMNREERKAFIEKKLNQRIPIKDKKRD